MELKTILERYNPWWKEDYNPLGIRRNVYLEKLKSNLQNKQIIFIMGLRRVGKTTIIKHFIQYLIEKEKVPPKKILFLTLDDSSLVNKTLTELIEEFRGLNSIKFEEKIYLFFDEVSYREDFSRELKVINDNQNVKIFASGSNSIKIIDKKAFLTGRAFTVKISPLNFEEFLEFSNLKISSIDKQIRDRQFKEYLKIGGMPEYVLTKNPDVITTLIEDIIYKDIARIYKIKNINKLREIFLLLCERVGKRVSYNKLAKIVGIDDETLAEYISYFQQTFIFSLVKKYSKSLNERVYSQKKIYISDNGIRNIFVGYKDIGSLFENYVFNEIKNKFGEMAEVFYYFEDNKEIDFILRKIPKEEIAIEVKFNEEVENNLEFFKKSKFEKKLLITNYEDIKKIS